MRGRGVVAGVAAGVLALSVVTPAAAQSIEDVFVPFRILGETFRQAPADLDRGVSGPLAPALDALAGDACDPTDPVRCLLPFPNDRFTTPDTSTPTGLRVDLPLAGMPRNAAGLPVQPTEWNRNDGFSPGALIATHLGEVDLAASFDLPAGVDDQIQFPSRSVDHDSPIVLLDTATGQRHPFWAELDTHPDTAPGGRLLLVRPLTNLVPGHRYVVAIRDLVDTDGEAIVAGETFATLRDELPSSACTPHAGGDTGRPDHAGRPDRPGRPEHAGRPDHAGGADRYDDDHQPSPAAGPAGCEDDLDGEAGRYQRLFGELDAAGVDVEELILAWDFTVASSQNLTGRAVSMRDEAFAILGDHDLTGEIAGEAPRYTIDEVERRGSDLAIRGTVEVPNFLTLPQDLPRVPPRALDTGIEQTVPGSRLYYGTPTPDPMATPQVNPLAPTMDAEFVCHLPDQAGLDRDGLATPTLYGHGLLGGIGEAAGGSTSRLRADNFLVCATPWIGMAPRTSRAWPRS